MKIITSHERTDMDALASMYGAWLLYPDHRPVLPVKLNRNLRAYLALYADALPFVDRATLPKAHVTQLLLVDTHTVAPFRGMGARTAVHIIDHHTGQPAPEGATVEGDAVGATSTLLVERIRARGAAVSTEGATLLLMGIYEDTGSLSYLTTTSRDAQAAAWLLEQGADLSVANEFLHNPLTPAQREVLARLSAASEFHTIQGRSICIAAVALDVYVDELSSLIHQLTAMVDPDGCFLLAQYEQDVQIIARSTTDAIDVSAILRHFGGGGHSKAAAALALGTDLADVRQALLTILAQEVAAPVPVLSIMSTNVHTVDPAMSAREAAALMRRYGHEGFPVVDGDRLVGVLTRSDIDRALHHSLGEMTVRSLLHSGPLYVRPGDPVEEVERVMIEHNLGQVPVVENGHFVGIVTRTDVIKLRAPGANHATRPEVRPLLDAALPASLRALLVEARDVANAMGYSLYIVGGFVRDLLLGVPTLDLDLDLVVEGDAIRLAERLAQVLGTRARSHSRFGTAKVILDPATHPDAPPSLDFVTARTEFYERPTELPQVERSSIKQDLYRRDFTINTMAICLDRSRYGELLDFYGGTRDLATRRIRVLHNLSFIEDPTRILRAARFEQRLGFRIEERTEELIDDALPLLEHVSGERLRNELFLILEEEAPGRVLERLRGLGVLAYLAPGLAFPRDLEGLFARLRARFGALAAAPQPQEAGASLRLCYLAVLTYAMDQRSMAGFAERLRLSQRDTRFLREVALLRDRLPELHAPAMLPSHIYRLLEPYSREARFVLSVLTDSAEVEERLDLYERTLSHVRPRVDGHYLRRLGVAPGPIYGEILSRLRDAILDGQVRTPEEEDALARSLAEGAHRTAN
ncbi:MAG: CBS domain-containing protein [Chloroflexi bacterium]|nr:CBS domain-containing protein [Chloroflexota bacterium]